MIIKYSVGLDVSSKDVKCCMSTIDSNQIVKVRSSTTISNSKTGFTALKNWIEKHHTDKSVSLYVCMEATGVYHENCALYLSKHSYKVSVILPNKAKRYLQALGLKSKNDSIDAKGLAQMGAEQNLKSWTPMAEFFYVLRAMTRHHQSLQEQKTALKNQLHAQQFSMYSSKTVMGQIVKAIALIDKQIKDLGLAIGKHISSNEQMAERISNLCTIKGLGLLTAATIIAETNGFELFDNYKQVVSYAGYDVIENQSGSHVGKTKISKKGNSRIRRVLFMPAFTAKTYGDTTFSNLYDRTFERHGIKMKSYVAIQKKLLILIYHLWKKNQPYDANYHLNIQEREQGFTSSVKTIYVDADKRKVAPI